MTDAVIIETVVSVLAKLAITLIGVFGAWLVAKIGQNQKLTTIASAVDELTTAVQITVMELQQTTVEGMKAASKDGKLTKDEITQLGQMLYKGAMEKLSDPAAKVLTSAEVDIGAIITGAGEALIAEMHQ